MTAQVVTGPRLRSLEPGEIRALGPLLDAAFSSYRDATRFAQPVLDFLDDWAWAARPLSVGLEATDGLVGVALGTLREALWAERPLTAVHLGPIGVRPGHRRRGLGAHLLQAVEERASAHGADVLTLTTEVVYGAWRLYERHGFEVLESYRPVVRPLFPALPGRAGLDAQGVETLDRAAFAARFEPPPARDGAIVERWTAEPDPPRVLRPRWFAEGTGAVATLRWPVLSHGPQGRVQVWATQILRLRGAGNDRARVLAAAIAGAREDQSVCIYALPTVATALPGFSSRGAPLVHRMVKPLTRAGRRACREATAWDEVCPAP